MNTYFVTYLLDNSDETYHKISRRLRNYPKWAKLFARAWLIRTGHSPNRVRDELVDAIEEQGQVVVIEISDSAWSTFKIDEEVIRWMKDNV